LSAREIEILLVGNLPFNFVGRWIIDFVVCNNIAIIFCFKEVEKSFKRVPAHVAKSKDWPTKWKWRHYNEFFIFIFSLTMSLMATKSIKTAIKLSRYRVEKIEIECFDNRLPLLSRLFMTFFLSLNISIFFSSFSFVHTKYVHS
jgi:hypothetical protein